MNTSVRLLVRTLTVLVLLLGAADAGAVAQTGAPLLDYPVHARLVGMGQTGAADNSDPSAIYYNPANAVAAPRAYLIGSYMGWPEDWFVDDLWAARVNAGFAWQGSGSGSLHWGADLSLGQLDYGESISTLPDGTPLGEFHSFERVASLAFALAIPSGSTWEFRAGVAAKRWWADYAPAEFTQDPGIDSPSAYAFDAGFTAVMKAAFDGWTVNPALAVAIVDAGPDFDAGEGEDPLPRRLNFGASVSIQSPPHRLGTTEVPLVALVANVDGADPHYGAFTWGMGTELAVAQILFLRTGVHVVHDEDTDDEIFSGYSVGLGAPISSFRIRADYSKTDYYFNTSTEHVGVALAWVF